MGLFGRKHDRRRDVAPPRADAADRSGPPDDAGPPRDGSGAETAEIRALRAAVRDGDLRAAERLGKLLAERDVAHQGAAAPATAEREPHDRPRRRPAGGDRETAHHTATELLRQGETAEAERLLDRAARSGHAESAYLLAQLRRDRGEHARAVELMRLADRAGKDDAARLAALWLLEDGDAPAAVPLLRKAVSRGDRTMIPALVSALLAVGDLDAAEAAVRPAAESGDWRAQYDLLAVRQERARRTGGDLADRELWALLKKAATGLLAEVTPLVNDGRLGEAEELLRGPAAAGDPVAMENLAIVMMRRGGGDPAVRAEARTHLERSAALGNTTAEDCLTELDAIEVKLATQQRKPAPERTAPPAERGAAEAPESEPEVAEAPGPESEAAAPGVAPASGEEERGAASEAPTSGLVRAVDAPASASPQARDAAPEPAAPAVPAPEPPASATEIPTPAQEAPARGAEVPTPVRDNPARAAAAPTPAPEPAAPSAPAPESAAPSAPAPEPTTPATEVPTPAPEAPARAAEAPAPTPEPAAPSASAPEAAVPAPPTPAPEPTAPATPTPTPAADPEAAQPPAPAPRPRTPDAGRMTVAEALARVYAVLLTEAELPEGHRDGDETELVPGVEALTAFDAPDALRLLSTPGIAALGDPVEVFRRAVENLMTVTIGQHHTLGAPGGAVFHRMAGASPFTASTVLVLDRTVAAATGRPLPPDGALVGIPTRYELVFHPLRDSSARGALEAMAHHTAGRYAQGPAGLAPAVYWWRAGALTPLSGLENGSAVPVTDPDFEALLLRLPPAPAT